MSPGQYEVSAVRPGKFSDQTAADNCWKRWLGEKQLDNALSRLEFLSPMR